ncbi:MAG TPA: 30S ribosomal protein S4e, partial [Candidatus Eisenbacteria bacterium]|nr:30S ribosomal protein S4e [Candidatus Eisenbacteria bacterium]
LKRKPAPRFWPIHRKEFTWAVNPTPGPHSSMKCMPLAIILRDTLGLADTRKEAKTIVAQGKVQVDGKTRRNDDFPIGVMDIVSMPDADKAFCVLPYYRGLLLHQIALEQSNFKLCRIEDKTTNKNGHVQLHLHDGSNIVIKIADPKNPHEDLYQTLDTLKISLPEKQILEHTKMKEKDFAVITGGKNVGKFGKIVEIEKAEGKKRRNALVTIEDEKGNRYQTTLEFVFALGETKPLISLPEAA